MNTGSELKARYNDNNRGVYFIGTAPPKSDTPIDQLTHYAIEYKILGIKLQRIILTFSPCGNEKNLEFIEWLGVSVPEATSLRISNAEKPLYESIRICSNSLQEILDAVIPYNLPLGLNIENLTNRKEEIDGSILLYKLLRSIMGNYLAKNELLELSRYAT